MWVREAYDGAPPVLNLNNGKVKTRFGSWGMPAPAFSGRTGFFVVGGVLHAADAATPDTAIWTFTGDGGGLTSAPIVVNGYVYAASQSGTVYAIDPATGQAVWSAGAGAEIGGPGEQNVSPVDRPRRRAGRPARAGVRPSGGLRPVIRAR
jgi:outer membrane protein assembly factor BamB